MKKTTITFITTAALAFAMPLYAASEQGMNTDSQQKEGVTQQQTGQMMTGQMMTGQMQSGKMITAKELEGMEVVSQKGEELGEIEKITIDKQSGEVKFVTFSRGGILGVGGEEIAAPLSAFEIRDDKARLTVDQSKLDNVPQQKAAVTDSDYQRDLETHYGVAPAWEKGNQDDATRTRNMEQVPANPGKVNTKN